MIGHGAPPGLRRPHVNSQTLTYEGRMRAWLFLEVPESVLRFFFIHHKTRAKVESLRTASEWNQTTLRRTFQYRSWWYRPSQRFSNWSCLLISLPERKIEEEDNLLFSCCVFDQPDVIMALRWEGKSPTYPIDYTQHSKLNGSWEYLVWQNWLRDY